MKEKANKFDAVRVELTQQGADLMLWHMLGHPGLREEKSNVYEQMMHLPRGELRRKAAQFDPK